MIAARLPPSSDPVGLLPERKRAHPPFGSVVVQAWCRVRCSVRSWRQSPR
jgi:hypothetical protein